MPVFIEILRKCVPAARNSFAEQGHSLHLIYLREVENARPRPAGEKNFQEFLDEILHESIMLNVPWTPVSRLALGPEQRSQYLDFLALREKSNENDLSLDPNFNIFLQLGAHRTLGLTSAVAEEKQNELRLSLKKFNTLEGKNFPNSLNAVCEYYGLKRKSSSRDEITWVGSWPRLKMTLRIMDLLATKKWSAVIVGCVFDHLPNKEFGIIDFMAGAELYVGQNKKELEKIFSFDSQVDFFCNLARLIDNDLRANAI